HSSAPEAGSRPTISGPRSTTTASRVVSSTRVPYRSDHTTVPSARTASNPFPAGSSTNHSTPGASGEAGAGFTEPSSSVTTSPSSSTTAPRPEADPTANRPGPSSCTQDHTSPSASTWSIRAPSRAKVAYTPQPSSTTLRALVVTDTRSASTVASGPSPCSAQAIASTGVNATSARQRSVPVVASSRTTRTSRPSDTSRGVQTPVSSHTAFRGGGPVRRARTTLPSGPGNTVPFSPSSAGRVRAAPSAPIATISRSPAGPCTQVSTSAVSVAPCPAGAQVASSPAARRPASSPGAGSTATAPSTPGGPSPRPPPSWATAAYTVAGGSTSSPSRTTTCWSRPGATEAPLRSY